ncbi:hypothetical protein ACFE04_026568 [Oxalis oulophora]
MVEGHDQDLAKAKADHEAEVDQKDNDLVEAKAEVETLKKSMVDREAEVAQKDKDLDEDKTSNYLVSNCSLVAAIAAVDGWNNNYWARRVDAVGRRVSGGGGIRSRVYEMVVKSRVWDI